MLRKLAGSTGTSRLCRAFVLLCAGTLLPGVGVNAETSHLDDATRNAILSEHFRTVDRVADIPMAVMTAAAKARGPKVPFAKLEMADPGDRFQVTDVIVTPHLPGYRLISAHASDDHWVLLYEVGGVAHTYHVAVFTLRDGHARFVWHASVHPKLTGFDDLRKRLRDRNAPSFDDSCTSFYRRGSDAAVLASISRWTG